MKGLRFIAEHKWLSLLMAAVLVTAIGASVYGAASGHINFGPALNAAANAASETPAPVYEGQDATHLQGPVGLLVSAPVVGCPTVDQAGLHTQDIPVGETFVYATQAYGGFCGAEMLLKGTTDVEIVSKPVPWAAVYNIKVNGLHTSTCVVFSYGESIVAGSETATSPDGAVYTATPIAVWIFSLPSTDPIDLGTAELALPQSFPGTTYYPVIERAGEYGLPQYSSVLDAILQNPPMK